MEVLKKEKEQSISVRSLDQYRSKISLPKPHKISDCIRKSPKLFELYNDKNGILWCALTRKAYNLIEEAEKIIRNNPEEATEYVTRMLMMSVDKVLALDKIAHFRMELGLPADFREKELKAGSREFDKRAIAVMHEMLSFMNERRFVTDHLTHFRREFVMPQKLMRLLLKHFGIFYVSERGKRFSVFLTEAYEGSELIEKCPLVVCKEKVLSLTGYRGREKKIDTFDDLPESEDEDLFESDSEGENHQRIDEPLHGETIGDLENILEDSETDIAEVSSAYMSRS